jgi:Pyridoxamine 5'-phosphate oxidase
MPALHGRWGWQAVAKAYPEINETLRNFIQAQSVFFVATAPLDANGHVNLSPKGLDTFRILGPRKVAYLDIFGSGVETLAHLRENGRIVLMFCAFQGAPKILRLHGLGRAVEPDEVEFAALQAHFPVYEGTRAIMVVEVTRISDSCGFGVPLLKYEGERPDLPAWCRKRGTEGLKIYRQEKNRQSIDGLPGVKEQVD